MNEQTSEQTDVSAAAAARLEAVRRNRREAERAAFIRQVILIVGLLILIGGVAWVFHVTHRQKMERLRLEAQEAERQRAADEEKRQRMAQEQAIQNEKDREVRRQAEENRLRLQKEQAERRAAQEAAAKAAKENAARYRACESRFRDTTMSRLSTAPDSERPDRVKHEATFLCLAPGGGKNGYEMYEVKVTPGFPMKIECLRPDAAPRALSDDEFKRQMASVPYLLLGGSHVYLRPDPVAVGRKTYAVPNAAVVFSPSQIELGGLAEGARRLGVTGSAAFSYKVMFRPKGGGGDWPVSTIPFDGRVTRSDFAAAVRAEMSRRKRGRAREIPAAEVDAVLDEGSALFSVVGGY